MMIKSTIPMLFKFNIGEGYDKIFLKYNKELYNLENNIDPDINYGDFSNKTELNKIDKKNINSYLIIINDKHVGIIVIENIENDIWISKFFINNKYRNNGYGKYIINLIKEKYKNKELFLRVLSKNINSINFYKSCGFKKEFEENNITIMSSNNQ